MKIMTVRLISTRTSNELLKYGNFRRDIEDYDNEDNLNGDSDNTFDTEMMRRKRIPDVFTVSSLACTRASVLIRIIIVFRYIM